MEASFEYLAAIDPGREKCGFAIVAHTGEILRQKILDNARLEEELQEEYSRLPFLRILLGNGTSSREAKKRIEEAIEGIVVELVDEYKTTELARKLYFKMHPPQGWKKILPRGLQTPPVPVDDYVAILLAWRYYGIEKEIET